MSPVIVFSGAAAVVFLVVVGFLIMNILSKRDRIKAVDEKRAILDAKIIEDLRPVAELLGGKLEGTGVATDRGVLTIFSSQPTTTKPADMTKFTATVASPFLLQLVPLQDADTALPFKGTHPVMTGNPEVDLPYKLISSDDAFAKKLVTPELLAAVRKLDAAVNSRARLFVAKASVSVLAPRGLHKPDDLKAFYDGSLAIVELIRPLLA